MVTKFQSYIFSVQFVKDLNGGLIARSKVIVIEPNSECSLYMTLHDNGVTSSTIQSLWYLWFLKVVQTSP